MRISRGFDQRRLVSRAIAALALLLTAACTGLRGPPDPAMILVRNCSAEDLRVVSLHEVLREGATGARRMGSVSPVPRGVTQVFRRPSAGPPLPPEIELRWTFDSGSSGSQQFDVAAALDAAGVAEAALVFEILPEGRARVLLEAPSGPPEAPGR